MKTIIYGGHLSNFGFNCIVAIIENPFFVVETVVIADLNRWISFFNRLNMSENIRRNKRLKRNHRKQTVQLRRLLSAKKIELKLIASANATQEYHYIRNYDLVLSAAFPQIFSKEFLKCSKKVLNLHPSYLPKCRGANPIYWTIAKRENFGGISCHFMTDKIDRGPIATRLKIPFDKDNITYEVLHQQIIDNLPVLIEQLANFFKEKKKPLNQDEKSASFFKEDRDIHHKIYWKTENFDEIDAKVRAGGAFTLLGNLRISVFPPTHFELTSKFATNDINLHLEDGTLIHFTNDQLWIKIKDGYLTTPYRIQARWFQLIKRFLPIKIIKYIFTTGTVFK